MHHRGLNPPGTVKARSQRFESIVLQVALFAFFKTALAAGAAEDFLKAAEVRPSLTEHPVAVEPRAEENCL